MVTEPEDLRSKDGVLNVDLAVRNEVEPDGSMPAFFTADRELSKFWSNLVGAKISWRLPWVHRALELEAKVDYFHFGYVDFALLASRDGANIEAGLNVAY